MSILLSFSKKTKFPLSNKTLFEWHEKPGALERLTPPWEKVVIDYAEPSIQDGSTLSLRSYYGCFSQKWHIQHHSYIPNIQFCDKLIDGFFPHWEHTHTFEAQTPNSCILQDCIEYALPYGKIGHTLGKSLVEKKLQRLFNYRHTITYQDLVSHPALPSTPLKILLTGGSGMIGSRLIPYLRMHGHHIIELSHKPRKNAYCWHPKDPLPNTVSEGIDAVIHLAGAPITNYWTQAQKIKIYKSRVEYTQALCESLCQLKNPPKTLITASGIHINPFLKNTEISVSKDTSTSNSFLAHIVKEWELATQPAIDKGIRVIHLRSGAVISPSGGLLQSLLPFFKLGLGSYIGDGLHYFSWISLEDIVAIISFCLHHPSIQGPINATAPQIIKSAQFTHTLAKIIGPKAHLHIPKIVINTLLGQMGKELLLSSIFAYPEKLHSHQFTFRHPDLSSCLKFYLN